MTSKTPEIKIIGPYSSEYSLAKVNREFANALDNITDKYKITLYAGEEDTDRKVNKKDFERYPELKKLVSEEKSHSEVAIYNNFPKSFPQSFGLEKIDADVKLVYLAWEETGFPEAIAMEFNEQLHGVMVTSEHVQRVLRNAGVKIPIINIGEGLDRGKVEVQNYKLNTKKKFKFLHVSSGLPRKGVDVLLKAYFEEFTKEDDVVLVIKTYHNEANMISDLLEVLTNENSPEVEVIYDLELTEGEMASLYLQADAVVLPSRAEGFGLPQAEAMKFETPLITTSYSGQIDFVNEENSWLLDYELVQADSQLALLNSYWAEPDQKQLSEFMRELYENPLSTNTKTKTKLAKKAADRLTWERTGNQALEFIEQVIEFSKLKQKKLAVIGPINSKGGIEEYTRDLYKPISRSFFEMKVFANSDAEVFHPDNEQVERTWEMGENNFHATIKSVNKYAPDIVHIQYNSPFYSLSAMNKFVSGIDREESDIYLTLHSLPKAELADYLEALGELKTIYVHTERHLEKLMNAGYQNVKLFKHGIVKFQDEDRFKLRKKLDLGNAPVIASHGLIHDKKGLLETVEAVRILKEKYPEIVYLSVNAVSTSNITSASVSRDMDELIEEYGLEKNVIRITEFLEVNEIMKLLHLADVIVLPYDDLDEGASGAVRFALASGRPIVRTKSKIFNELGDIGCIIDDNKPKSIEDGIMRVLEDKQLYADEVQKNSTYVENNSWDVVGTRYLTELS